MKVLMVTDFSTVVGGAEIYIAQLKRLLQREGVTVKSFYVEDHVDIKLNKYILKVKYKFLVQAQLEKKLSEKIEEFKPDIIHLHNIQTYPHTIFSVVKDIELPCFQTIHDLYQFNIDYREKKPIGSQVKGKIYEYLRKRQIETVSHFLTYSEFVTKNLTAHIPASSVTTIPYPYKSEKRARKNLNFMERPREILYIGRIEPEKGVEFLIDSFLSLKILENYKLLIVGTGSREKFIKKKVEKHDRVHYLGYSSEPEKYFRKSRILVVPSVWEEPFGIVGLEGFDNGIAVIASDVGGIPEWCIHGETGLLFKAHDRENLTKRLKESITDPSSTMDRIEKAYHLLQDKFSPQNHVERHIQLYKEAMS